MDFSSYKKITTDDLQQGDFIEECPIVIPPSKIEAGGQVDIEIRLIDSIILSQSCDLANDKLDIVLVCPYHPLKLFLKDLPGEQTKTPKSIKRIIDNLRKGYLQGYHLLNKDVDNFVEDYIVVDFKNVYGIQLLYLKDIVGNRLNRIRLLPPYREHLSQSFARYFMRVGLPQDIEIEGYY